MSDFYLIGHTLVVLKNPIDTLGLYLIRHIYRVVFTYSESRDRSKKKKFWEKKIWGGKNEKKFPPLKKISGLYLEK